MAWFALARVLFVAAVAYSAAILLPLPVGLPANVGFALALAAMAVLFESRLRETAVTRVLGALIGCAIGLGIAHAIVTSLFWADSGDRRVEFLHSFTLIVLPYLGLVLGGKHGEWLEPARLGKIVTNDFNLNKVAQLRGVDVLNVNELANALKPVVLPGEIMKVFILKEGKEYNQGVAYLDDGTMVVVDNARKMISKTIDIVVTSVLQTTAGKMIFGRFIDAGMGANAPAAAAARDRQRRGPAAARTDRCEQRPAGRAARDRTGDARAARRAAGGGAPESVRGVDLSGDCRLRRRLDQHRRQPLPLCDGQDAA